MTSEGRDGRPAGPGEGRRIALTGTVQGVGFRPFVYRARARDRDRRPRPERRRPASPSRPSARPPRSTASSRACAPIGPPRRSIADLVEERIAPEPVHGFEILESGARDGAARRDPARPRHLRRLPARGERPRRPAPRLPVHELHRLRPALHDRARRALRPARDHHGRLPDVRRLRARVRRPGRPPLPRAAERVPAPADPGWCSATRERPARRRRPTRSRRSAAALAGGRDRRGEGDRRLPPRLRRDLRRGGPRAAGAASGARRSRSR